MKGANESQTGVVVKVSGPLVVAEGLPNARMFDVVSVSELGLIGEIIELKGDKVYIQVYEETGGIGPGEKVITSGVPLSVELGPGLITTIYDGIQRPLRGIVELHGERIPRGVRLTALDRDREWDFSPRVEAGAEVTAGDVIGVVPETPLVEHRVMVPVGISGRVREVRSGSLKVVDPVAIVETTDGPIEITMLQTWPVRRPRPIAEKLPPRIPLTTGQRVIDFLFPVAKGGTACVPGPFGSGKTVIQHQLAKWADADIVVYVGCGERGNEMTDVLIEFPELSDPRSGRPLMERTVLIANTSNMPVAAREASVYTGITLAEYYRDMGYSVALMADSTSRWAEAMREISGRLQEMPGEEGYPAYLGSRIASFYERAGRVICLGKDRKEGSLTAIGAVSPPGGDLSDPVVQATLRVVKVFWSLEDRLAYQRHFPAISWLNSYSLYHPALEPHFQDRFHHEAGDLRREAARLLEEEAELAEIVKLVGPDALSDRERLILATARAIREDFLHQNAFHPVDTYTSPSKEYLIIEAILSLHRLRQKALEEGCPLDALMGLPVEEAIAKAKFLPEEKKEGLEKLRVEVAEAVEKAWAAYRGENRREKE